MFSLLSVMFVYMYLHIYFDVSQYDNTSFLFTLSSHLKQWLIFCKVLVLSFYINVSPCFLFKDMTNRCGPIRYIQQSICRQSIFIPVTASLYSYICGIHPQVWLTHLYSFCKEFHFDMIYAKTPKVMKIFKSMKYVSFWSHQRAVSVWNRHIRDSHDTDKTGRLIFMMEISWKDTLYIETAPSSTTKNANLNHMMIYNTRLSTNPEHILQFQWSLWGDIS